MYISQEVDGSVHASLNGGFVNLLERDTEINLMQDLLRSASGGQGSVLVLLGRAGHGRTSVLTACADVACAAGFHVTVTALTRFDRRLVGAMPSLPPEGGHVVCVDDVQDGDDESIATVLRLVADTATCGSVVVLGVRPTRREALCGALQYIRERPNSREHWLAPLTMPAVRRILESECGFPVNDDIEAQMLALADGDLTLLHAIAADYGRSASETGHRTDTVLETPGTAYRHAILDSYHRFDTAERSVAQAIAILDEFANSRTVSEVADVPVETVDLALAGLTSAGLLVNGRFRCDVAGDVIVTEEPLGPTVVLHRRAAAVLRAAGAPAVRVARHLVAADYVDECWAEYLLAEAVTQATTAGDDELATDMLRLAARGVRDQERRGRVLAHIASRYTATDPDMSCQYFHDAACFLPVRTLWCEHSSALSEQMARRGRGADAAAQIVAVASGATGDDEVRLAADRLLIAGDYPALLPAAPLDASAEAHTGSRIQRTRYDAARFLMDTLMRDQLDTDLVTAAKEEFACCVVFNEATATASLAALHGLVYAGEAETADALAEELVDFTRRRHVPVWQARLLAVQAEAALRAGKYVDALSRAEEAMALVPIHALGTWIGAGLSTLLIAGTIVGAVDVVNRHWTVPVPAAMFETRYGLHYLYARGHAHLVAGRCRAALANFSICGRLMRTWRIDHERILPWRLAVAGALLTLGEQDRAVNLIEDWTNRVMVDAPVYCLAGPDRVDVGGRMALRENAFTLLTAGSRQGDLVESIRRIGTVPGDETMTGTAQYKIEDRFSAYLNKLTLSERQVAVLAAKGHTNRYIARTLSVTTSTVEQHLTRTYRKLQVTGRQELRAKLG